MMKKRKRRKRRIIILVLILILVVGSLMYLNEKFGLQQLLRTNFAGGKTVVVLDAGHGGHDPGCGVQSPYEKEVTLNIVKKVQKTLEQDGLIVVLTREDDTFISLGDRVLASRVNHGDLFVSVHLNWADNRDAYGIETYCNEELNADSKILAQAVQAGVLEQTKSNDRKVHADSGYYVVRNSKVPSCLVEVGFLSSKKEGKRLTKDAYQTSIAEGIVDGIHTYIQTIGRSET